MSLTDRQTDTGHAGKCFVIVTLLNRCLSSFHYYIKRTKLDFHFRHFTGSGTEHLITFSPPSALLTVNHGKFPKQEDSYAFEEDSGSESLSPDQHHSDESQGSACPSSEAAGSAASSSSSPGLTSPRQVRRLWLLCPPLSAERTAAASRRLVPEQRRLHVLL